MIGSEDQRLRRNYVRTVFAFIDGVNYCIEQVALERESFEPIARQDAKDAAAAEIAALSSAAKPERSAPAKQMRRTFAALAAAHGAQNPLDVTGPEWAAFLDAINLRNDLTHPKGREGLLVTDARLQLARQVHKWFYRVSGDLLRVCGAADQKPGDGSELL